MYMYVIECGTGCDTCTINDADVTNPTCLECAAKYVLDNAACYGTTSIKYVWYTYTTFRVNSSTLICLSLSLSLSSLSCF